MAGAKEHVPRLATVDTVCPAKMSRQLEAALSVWHPESVRWLKKGGPMPAWIFPSPEGTSLPAEWGQVFGAGEPVAEPCGVERLCVLGSLR